MGCFGTEGKATMGHNLYGRWAGGRWMCDACILKRGPFFVSADNWSAELFYGSLALLDLYFVSHYDGSFSENFYGLHRVNALDGKVNDVALGLVFFCFFFAYYIGCGCM